jgi:hypothetical protein
MDVTHRRSPWLSGWYHPRFYHVRQKTDREGYDLAELMGGGTAGCAPL